MEIKYVKLAIKPQQDPKRPQKTHIEILTDSAFHDASGKSPPFLLLVAAKNSNCSLSIPVRNKLGKCKNCSFKQNWLKMGLELIKASIRKAKFRYMTKSYPAIVLPYPSHRSIDYDDDHRMIYTDCRNLCQQTFHENFMITLRTSEFSKNIRLSTNDDFTCCKLSFQLASMFLIINSDILFLCFSSIPFQPLLHPSSQSTSRAPYSTKQHHQNNNLLSSPLSLNPILIISSFYTIKPQNKVHTL